MAKYEEELKRLAREQIEKIENASLEDEEGLSVDDSSKDLEKKLKSKSVDSMDLEDVNEQNIKNYRVRNTRNKAIIVILTILLIIVVAVISILVSTIYYENNSFLYVHGSVDAVYIVEGEEMERFRTPTSIKGNRCLDIDIYVQVRQSGLYNVNFSIEVYAGEERLQNVIARNYDRRFIESSVTDGDNTYMIYRSENPINFSYDNSFRICDGILLDAQYEDVLNFENFHMEIHTYFERVS